MVKITKAAGARHEATLVRLSDPTALLLLLQHPTFLQKALHKTS